MKKQFLFAMMAVVAVLFAACELNSPNRPSGDGSGKDTTQRDTTGGDTTAIDPEHEDADPLYPVPTVTATQGAVTLMLKFDEPVCSGVDVVFVGKYNGCNWMPEQASRMTPVKDGWYKVVIAPDAAGDLCGRPIMYDGNVANWNYTWVHNLDNLVPVWHVQDRMLSYNEFSEVTLYFEKRDADAAKVIYIESKEWKQTPCSSDEHEYHVTLYGPASTCGVDFTLEILGSFGNWEQAPIPMSNVRGSTWTATVMAHEGDEYKIRGVVNGVGTWDIQIRYWLESEALWAWFPNWVFDSDTDVELIYNDENSYMWSTCINPEE